MGTICGCCIKNRKIRNLTQRTLSIIKWAQSLPDLAPGQDIEGEIKSDEMQHFKRDDEIQNNVENTTVKVIEGKQLEDVEPNPVNPFCAEVLNQQVVQDLLMDDAVENMAATPGKLDEKSVIELV